MCDTIVSTISAAGRVKVKMDNQACRDSREQGGALAGEPIVCFAAFIILVK